MKPTSFKQYIARSLILRSYERDAEIKQLKARIREMEIKMRPVFCKYCEEDTSSDYDVWHCTICKYIVCRDCREVNLYHLDDKDYCGDCKNFTCVSCDGLKKDHSYFTCEECNQIRCNLCLTTNGNCPCD